MSSTTSSQPQKRGRLRRLLNRFSTLASPSSPPPTSPTPVLETPFSPPPTIPTPVLEPHQPALPSPPPKSPTPVLERYQYTPLPFPRCIRTLDLHPAPSFDSPIHISLNTVPLPSNPDLRQPSPDLPTYETLSYVWGTESSSPADTVTILSPPSLSTGNTLPVTPNLASFLRHLRVPDRIGTLWIDALCIDQSNLAERSAQVALMGEIYVRARHTIIWLGPEEASDNAYAFSLLEAAAQLVHVDWTTGQMTPTDLARRQSAAMLLPGGSRDPLRWADRDACLTLLGEREQRALGALFARAWFQRLWVRQEAFMSRSKSLICGGFELPWQVLMTGVFCLYARPYLTCGDAFDEEFLRARTVVYELCQSQKSWIVYGTLRRRLRDLGWKEARDAIYAVRHLLSPSHRLVEVVPDYARPVPDVFEEVATRVAAELKDVSFLGTCEMGSSSLAGLPTWVPDWSSPMQCKWLIEPIWSASAWVSAHIESAGPGRLRVRGVPVARVDKTQGLVRTPAETPMGYWYDRGLIADTIKTFLPRDREALEQSYVGGGSLLEAYCLALHRGRTAENFASGHSSMLPMARAKTTLLEIFDMKDMPVRGKTEAHMENFLSDVNSELYGRCFVSTVEGYIALAPAATEAGDMVCVLLGIHIPLILRQTSTPGQWQVVGSCLVPGLMWGEAITGVKMPHCRPVRYDAKPEDLIDGHAVRMTDSRDETSITDPVKMLESRGIGVASYQREPHLLEVQADALRGAGIDLVWLELV